MLLSNGEPMRGTPVDTPPPLRTMQTTRATATPLSVPMASPLPPVRKKRPRGLLASPLLPSTLSLCMQSGYPSGPPPKKHLFALPSSISLPASRHTVSWSSEGDPHLPHHSPRLQEEEKEGREWASPSYSLENTLRCGSASGRIEEENEKREDSGCLHRLDTTFSYSPCFFEEDGRTMPMEGWRACTPSCDPESSLRHETLSVATTATTPAAPPPSTQCIPLPVDFQVRHFTSNALRALLYLWYYFSFVSFLLIWIPSSRWVQFSIPGETYGVIAFPVRTSLPPRGEQMAPPHHRSLWEKEGERQSQTTMRPTAVRFRALSKAVRKKEFLAASPASPPSPISSSSFSSSLLPPPRERSSLVWRWNREGASSSFSSFFLGEGGRGSDRGPQGRRQRFFFFPPGRRLQLHLPPSPLSFLQPRDGGWALHVKMVRFTVWPTPKKNEKEEERESVERPPTPPTTSSSSSSSTVTRNRMASTPTISVLSEEATLPLPRRQLWFPDVWLKCAAPVPAAAAASSSFSLYRSFFPFRASAEGEETTRRESTTILMSCDALTVPMDLCHDWTSCSLYVSFDGLPEALITWWAGGGAGGSASFDASGMPVERRGEREHHRSRPRPPHAFRASPAGSDDDDHTRKKISKALGHTNVHSLLDRNEDHHHTKATSHRWDFFSASLAWFRSRDGVFGRVHPTASPSPSSLGDGGEEEEDGIAQAVPVTPIVVRDVLSSSVVRPNALAGTTAVQSFVIAQRRGYTLWMLIARSLLFLVTIQRLSVFIGALQWSRATPEQQAIFFSFVSLLVYVNPLYALNIFSSSSSFLRWWTPWSSGSPVLAFLDVHFPYIFFTQVTLLVVYLSLCTLPWGVRAKHHEDEKKKKKKKKEEEKKASPPSPPPPQATPLGSGGSGVRIRKRMADWKAYWMQSEHPFFPPPWVSLVYVLLLGSISVLVVIRGIQIDTSPSYWILPSSSSPPRSLAVMLDVVQISIALVCVGCMVVSYVLPTYFHYTQLHSRWLAVRALERFYLPLVLVVLGELAAYRIYYPIVFPTLFPSSSEPQQSLNSASTLWVGCGIVYWMGLVYTGRSSCTPSSPIPIHPSDPRWKTMTWTEEWILLLATQGGQQYVFFSEKEERIFNALQPVYHGDRGGGVRWGSGTPSPAPGTSTSSFSPSRRGGRRHHHHHHHANTSPSPSPRRRGRAVAVEEEEKKTGSRPSYAVGASPSPPPNAVSPAQGPRGAWAVTRQSEPSDPREVPVGHPLPPPPAPHEAVDVQLERTSPRRAPRDTPRPEWAAVHAAADVASSRLDERTGKRRPSTSLATPAAFLVHLPPVSRNLLHRLSTSPLPGLSHSSHHHPQEVLLASYVISTVRSGGASLLPSSSSHRTAVTTAGGGESPEAVEDGRGKGKRERCRGGRGGGGGSPLRVEEEATMAMAAYFQQMGERIHAWRTTTTTTSSFASSSPAPVPPPSSSSAAMASTPVVWGPPVLALQVPERRCLTASTTITPTNAEAVNDHHTNETTSSAETNAKGSSSPSFFAVPPPSLFHHRNPKPSRWNDTSAGPLPSFFFFSSRTSPSALGWVARGMRASVLFFLTAMAWLLHVLQWMSGGGWGIRLAHEKTKGHASSSSSSSSPHPTKPTSERNGSVWENLSCRPPSFHKGHTAPFTFHTPSPSRGSSASCGSATTPRRRAPPDGEWPSAPHRSPPSTVRQGSDDVQGGRGRGRSPENAPPPPLTVSPIPIPRGKRTCQRCGRPLPRHTKPLRTTATPSMQFSFYPSTARTPLSSAVSPTVSPFPLVSSSSTAVGLDRRGRATLAYYCRSCRATMRREHFERRRFPNFFVLETAIDCCNLSLEVYKELKPITATDAAVMERLHPQMSTVSLLRMDPPRFLLPPLSTPATPLTSMSSTSFLQRTLHWSKRTWRSLHVGRHHTASLPLSREDVGAEEMVESGGGGGGGGVGQAGGGAVISAEASEIVLPEAHRITTTIPSSRRGHDLLDVSPLTVHGEGGRRARPSHAVPMGDTPPPDPQAVQERKKMPVGMSPTDGAEEEEGGGQPLPLPIPPEALIEPPYGWMNVAQFGYRLRCVKMVKKVQFLLAVLDTSLPMHAGKPSRMVIAFRGTSRMSNVKKDSAIWNVAWAEARPRERRDSAHRWSASRQSVSSSPSLAATAGTQDRPSSPLRPTPSMPSDSSDSDESDDERTREEGIGESERHGKKKGHGPKVWPGNKKVKKVYEQGGTVPMVHAGFLSLWQSLRTDVRKKIRLVERELDAARKNEKEWEQSAPHSSSSSSSSSELEVILTGHSLGGALAVLCAYHLSRWFRWRGGKTPRLVVYTFGQPSMGNTAFEKNYNHYVRHSFQVTNESDLVSAACGGFTGGTKVQVDRYGNYIVHPSQAETVLEPLKGKGLSVVHHLLMNYGASLNAIADGSGGECKVRVDKPYLRAQELSSLSVL